jgi:replicative DNA helicase
VIAEKAIVGAAVLGGAWVVDDARLSADDFFDGNAAKLWRFISEKHSVGEVVDTTVLLAAFPAMSTYIFECTSACAAPSAAVVYANQVHDAAVKRRMASIGARLAQEALLEGAVGDSLIDGVYRDLDALTASRASEEVSWLFENFSEYREQLDSVENNATCAIGPLDALLNGFRPGALYVIGARPAVGKTVVGLQIAFGLARSKTQLPSEESAGAVAFFSLEMSRRELINRLVAQVYEIDMGRLDRKELAASEKKLLDVHAHELSRLLTINDRGGQSLAGIRGYVRAMQRSGTGVKAIVIDYIGLIAEANSGRSRYEAMTQVSGALKAMAKEFNVPIIVLAQLNRAVEGRKETGPVMADLRDSGSIEQDADVVMLLNRRKSITSKGDWDLNVMQVAVAKNRHGQTGMMEFLFEGKFSRIREVTNLN